MHYFVSNVAINYMHKISSSYAILSVVTDFKDLLEDPTIPLSLTSSHLQFGWNAFNLGIKVAIEGR